MDPTTLSSASLGFQGAGAVFGALGAFMSASGNQAMLRGRAEVAEINARTEEANAQATLLAGGRAESRFRLNTGRLKSRQRVALAASGVALNEGSAVRALTDTDVLGEIDANQIQANAVREAWGHRIRATNYSNDAIGQRAAADAINPTLSGFTSLLGGAGQVAQSWYQMRKDGTLNTPSSPALTTGDFSRADRASGTYWG